MLHQRHRLIMLTVVTPHNSDMRSGADMSEGTAQAGRRPSSRKLTGTGSVVMNRPVTGLAS